MQYTKWLKYSAVTSNTYTIAGIGFCRSKDIITPIVTRNNITIIGIKRDAFRDNRQIESIVISEGVTNIGAYAFSGCRNLKKIVLPSTLTNIEDGAFAGCESLAEINMPPLVKNIPYALFKDCTALKGINLTHIEMVGAEAFSNCGSLTDVKMPKNPFDMSISDFQNCGFFSDKCSWNGNVLTVDGYVFGCREKRSSYRLSKDVKCILEGAFDSGKKYTKQLNSDYNAEMDRYDYLMNAYEVCLVCPNVPFTAPPDKIPQEYIEVPIPIQIHYEGTLNEWDNIKVYKSKIPYPFEITSSDGKKNLMI